MASEIPKKYYKYGLLAGLGIGAILEYENLDIAYNTLGQWFFNLGVLKHFISVLRYFKPKATLNV